MVDGIGLALNSIKSLSETAKALLELRDVAKISDLSIELNGKIAATQQLLLASQQEQAALIAEIDALKKQIVDFENWQAEKERYELKQLGVGFLAYVLKASERQSTAAHALCTNCFESRKKSILQSNGQINVYDHRFSCPSCGAQFASKVKDMGQLFETLE